MFGKVEIIILHPFLSTTHYFQYCVARRIELFNRVISMKELHCELVPRKNNQTMPMPYVPNTTVLPVYDSASKKRKQNNNKKNTLLDCFEQMSK